MAGLGCGTMYLYSGYAPQVAQRLNLSATQTSLLGMIGNMGMAFSGPFAGSLVDRRGLTVPFGMGAAFIFVGFYIIKSIFENAAVALATAASAAAATIEEQASADASKGPILLSPSYTNTAFFLLALAQVLVGTGSTYTFSSLVKCAAVNFPESRGTATSVPMAAFGLSAFFLSWVATSIKPGDTQTLLQILTTAPLVLFVVTIPFVRILRRSNDVLGASSSIQMTSLDSTNTPETTHARSLSVPQVKSRRSSLSTSSYENLTWTQLIRQWAFWHHFLVLGLLGGIGQMYIYSCGYCVRALALASHLDLTVQSQVQSYQVGAISVASFAGRLSSGLISDYIRLKLNKDRAHLLLAAGLLCVFAQALGLKVQSPDNLWALSAMTGLFYGICYGSYPTIVGDTFGMRNFSQNWGLLSLAPLPVSYCLNMIFGMVYDSHSTRDTDTGQRSCSLGNQCYRGSFSVTMIASMVLAFGLVPAMLYKKAKHVQ